MSSGVTITADFNSNGTSAPSNTLNCCWTCDCPVHFYASRHCHQCTGSCWRCTPWHVNWTYRLPGIFRLSDHVSINLSTYFGRLVQWLAQH